jgi:O-antigen/teichoic acid export membrane protein
MGLLSGRRSLLLSIFDQLAVSGCSFLFLIVATRLFGQEDVGRYVYAFVIYSLISLVSQNLFIYNHLTRNEVKEDSSRLFFHAALSVFCLCIFFGLTFAGEGGVCFVLYVYFSSVFDYERRISYLSDGKFLPVTLSGSSAAIFLIVMIFFVPKTIAQYFLLISAAYLPAVIISIFKAVRFRVEITAKYFKDMFFYSGWMLAGVPMNWFWGQLPVLFIGAEYGAKYVGIFGALRGIVNIVNVPLEVLNTYWAKKLLDMKNRGDAYRKHVLGVLLWAVGLASVFCFLAVLFSDSLLLRVLGSEYLYYGSFFKILVVNVVWLSALRVLSVFLRAERCPQGIFFPYMAGIVFFGGVMFFVKIDFNQVAIVVNFTSIFTVVVMLTSAFFVARIKNIVIKTRLFS